MGTAALKKTFERAISIMAFTGAIWIAALMIIVVLDVIGRNLNMSIIGVPEIARYSVPAITFLQLPYVLLKGRHIRSTVLFDKVKGKWNELLQYMTWILMIIFFALLIYAIWPQAWSSFITNEFTGEGSIRIPIAPMYFIIILSSICMIIQALLFLNNIRKNRT